MPDRGNLSYALSPIREAVKPPTAVARNAAKGLELRKRFRRGGSKTEMTRARSLSEREPQDEDDLRKMHGFFSAQADRPQLDRDADAEPSAADVAWLLWGGDEGRAWVEKNYAPPQSGAPNRQQSKS